ncbi:MAG TPA: PEP-CTERM sorting domain-containing protein, partial [Dongiaceae bacterium]
SKALAAFLNSVGATDGGFGDIEIPLAKAPGSFQSEFVRYDTFMHPPRWETGGLGSLDSLSYRWAQFAVAQTPVPATLPLFVSALGGLGFVGWRRIRTHA